MKKKADYHNLLWALASFFIASLYIGFCVFKISTSEGIAVQFFKSIENQISDINSLRVTFSKGRLFYGDCLSDIVTDHLYPSFILALLFGGKAAELIIKAFFYARFGLMAFSMHMLCVRNFKLNNLWALILSLAYAFSSLSLASSTNPQLMNLMIILPWAASSAEEVVRKESGKSFWKGVLTFSFIICAGFQGIITGILFLLALMWLLDVLVPNARFRRGVFALLISVIPMLLVIIPTLTAGMVRSNIISAFKDVTVSYKTFDLLTSCFDGVAITLPPDAAFAPLGLSVLVFVLVCAFFLTDVIPFKGKVTGLIVIVLFLGSCASTTVNTLLSVYGFDDAGAFMRMAALSVILIVMSAVSIKNISQLSVQSNYLIAFSLLALICISNVSSASEIVKSPFYLYFSAAAVIFWCACLREEILGDYRKLIAVICIGVIGLAINLSHELKISSFAGNLVTPAPYELTSSSTTLDTVPEDGIPLCGDRSEFIAVEQDLRTNSFTTYPEILNTISNAVCLQNVYNDASAFCVFSSGVINEGNSAYSLVSVPSSIEILIRCEGMNPAADYYVYSSFNGKTSLADETGVESLSNEFSSPFMRRLNRGVAASLRLIGEPTNQYGSFSIWEENADAMAILKNHISSMDNYTFTVPDNEESEIPNIITVVTSLPYSERYSMTVESESGKTECTVINLCGKLACVFQGNGVSDYTVSIDSSFTSIGFAIIIWFISSLCIIFNIVKKNKGCTKEESDVKQENN